MNNLGSLKSPRDLRNYRITKSVKDVELPKVFELKHSSIKNQGEVNSCVAFSMASILEVKNNEEYSTAWIYGYRPSDYYQGQGMYPIEALKTIKNIGYLEKVYLDKNVEMNEAKKIVDEKLKTYELLASNRKINAYAYLSSFEEIKQAIYLYKSPVIACIDIDENGLQLDNNYVAFVPTKPCGGHAVVCYGWNETGLLIQNSWGEEWGNKGTFILPYSYSFYEAWLIDTTEQKQEEKEEEKNEEPISPQIEKPNCYWLRELVMCVIKILRSIFKK